MNYFTDYLDSEQGWTSVSDLETAISGDPYDTALYNEVAAMAQAKDISSKHPFVFIRVQCKGNGECNYFYQGNEMVVKQDE